MLKSLVSPGQFVDHEHVVTLVIDEPRAIFLVRILDVLGSLPRVVSVKSCNETTEGRSLNKGQPASRRHPEPSSSGHRRPSHSPGSVAATSGSRTWHQA